jgi:hypothetical protein
VWRKRAAARKRAERIAAAAAAGAQKPSQSSQSNSLGSEQMSSIDSNTPTDDVFDFSSPPNMTTLPPRGMPSMDSHTIDFFTTPQTQVHTPCYTTANPETLSIYDFSSPFEPQHSAPPASSWAPTQATTSSPQQVCYYQPMQHQQQEMQHQQQQQMTYPVHQHHPISYHHPQSTQQHFPPPTTFLPAGIDPSLSNIHNYTFPHQEQHHYQQQQQQQYYQQLPFQQQQAQYQHQTAMLIDPCLSSPSQGQMQAQAQPQTQQTELSGLLDATGQYLLPTSASSSSSFQEQQQQRRQGGSHQQ